MIFILFLVTLLDGNAEHKLQCPYVARRVMTAASQFIFRGLQVFNMKHLAAVLM